MSARWRGFCRDDGSGQREAHGYQPTYPLGILVERGDRVQLRCDVSGIPTAVYAAWGTVVAVRGFGHVRLRLDDGTVFNAALRDLEFEKRGRPPLQSKEVRS